MPLTTTAGPGRVQDAPAGLDRFPQRIFLFRLLGMGLGAVCIASVLSENGAPIPVWAFCVFTGLLWPHLALYVASRSTAPYRAEVRNLLLDSAFAGAWIGLMQFNLLPSVLLFTLVTVDKISTGIPRLWLWSLPALAFGLLCGSAATGFAIRADTSTTVLLASLPMLLIHTIAVSLAGNRLVHKIREKNRQLDELSRTDSLTGLAVRRHWHELATSALSRHHRDGLPSTLLMLDIDHFKVANDHHGHSVGDEVLRAVADTVLDHAREGDHAGRYGGDEFGIVLVGSNTLSAQVVADKLLRAIRAITLDNAPGTHITASIGMAEAETRHVALEQWIEAADAALYRAKRAGRDRAEG
ncbi:MAG: diguanylate cyclase [Luteimonas sp.]|nr:diguanylate cyclase [Luteimonas sp.]